jgi:hypothetical protein
MLLVGFGIGVTFPLFTIALQAQFQTRIGEVTAATQFFRQIGGAVGVALLGGVMNASFGRELTSLVARDTPKLGSAAPFLGKLTADPSQLLTPFFADVKGALATGIASTFLWGFAVMAFAFVAMLVINEIPIPTRAKPETLAEIGTDLFAEEAVQPAEHEPVIVAGTPTAG